MIVVAWLGDRTRLRAAAVGSILLLAGCQSDELARRDSLGFGAGDAVQTNIATHVIDPWSRPSRELYAPTDGERMQRAVERYRTGAQSGALGSAALPATAAPTGTSAATGSGTLLR